MTDLDALVPPHEPAEDALAFAGKVALTMVPVVGSLAAETLAHALESRQAQRQHEFNVAIARAITTTLEQFDETATIEDIVGSDEFIAAVTRAQRAAAETASQQKRERLAAAVANGGSWAPFAATEREQFTRLVEEFDALHIWMLHYFTDPAGWLQARDLYQQHANIMMGGIDGPLGSAFNVHPGVWDGPVKQAAADLDRNGLASIPLTTIMSAQGIFAPRTSSKGQRFLAFINETDSIAADAPTEL
ncbi:hypothetical protein GCM10010401_08240 [Rarobacter faecitabidus]|uniref:Uncharacterized protein n=1 Tax=Rarobacter faecitabidus TaxID=13243 RepID=A0A542ZB08_RARFA|nr:hypothetical protein [Rarobacter faecitabidus]TQL57430.1 hypothetical protein FB461_2164 [Rarobacter faecitabidus]